MAHALRISAVATEVRDRDAGNRIVYLIPDVEDGGDPRLMRSTA
jgi:hypothetical protein